MPINCNIVSGIVSRGGANLSPVSTIVAKDGKLAVYDPGSDGFWVYQKSDPRDTNKSVEEGSVAKLGVSDVAAWKWVGVDPEQQARQALGQNGSLGIGGQQTRGVSFQTSGGNQEPTYGPNPCDASIPNNGDLYAGLVTVFHEHTSFGYVGNGTRQYVTAQDTRATTRTRGNYRTGDEITYSTLLREAKGFASAIYNSFQSMQRLESGRWKNWESYLKDSGRFGGAVDWNRGVKNIAEAQASAAGSDLCEYLNSAIYFLNKTYTKGPWSGFENVIQWRGIWQGNLLRGQGSSTRVADSDFLP